jgi:rhamnulokinase
VSERSFAAVDLGAESGRVVVGQISAERPTLETVHRFANVPVCLPDGLHWNLLELLKQVLYGLERAASRAPLAGVGIDTWGVDYALLDPAGRILGLPFHYRDSRTDGIIARAHARVPREELYAVTGIQTLPINTLFQLLADERRSALVLSAADRIALIPDLLAYWLTGTLANEVTIASTTGLLDATTSTWARCLIDRLGLPARPFSADPVEPGTMLGSVSRAHVRAAGRAVGVSVHAVAGHDTASAFAAAPLTGPRAAILSSGTWSLFGLELEAPVLTQLACDYNLTNERGIEGTTRLLANVMGLWLLQECRRQWEREGFRYEYRELESLATAAKTEPALFDPDHPRFLAPPDMPAEISAACRTTGQTPPSSPGGFVRAVLTSLACKYRVVLDRLQRATGRDIELVHMIGGGTYNALHCKLIADVLGRPVLAGPAEATALGNVLVQARAARELATLSEMRAIASRMDGLTTYEPAGDGAGDELYERFLDVTGVTVERPAAAIA